jgi:hypothetical protein
VERLSRPDDPAGPAVRREVGHVEVISSGLGGHHGGQRHLGPLVTSGREVGEATRRVAGAVLRHPLALDAPPPAPLALGLERIDFLTCEVGENEERPLAVSGVEGLLSVEDIEVGPLRVDAADAVDLFDEALRDAVSAVLGSDSELLAGGGDLFVRDACVDNVSKFVTGQSGSTRRHFCKH